MTDSKIFKYSSAGALLVSGCLAISYWAALSNLDTNTCSGPSYVWAVFAKWFLILSTVTLAVIIILNHYWKQHEVSTKQKIILWGLLSPNIGAFVYLAGTFIGFHYRDQCPGLHDLLVIMFVISILIVLSPFIVCLVTCLAVGVAGVSSLMEFKDQVKETVGYHNVCQIDEEIRGLIQ